MQRKFVFSIGEYYHIYSRGVDKREIFASRHDYNRFSILLYLCNSDKPLNMRETFLAYKGKSFLEEVFFADRGKTYVDIGAYCMMPNHFHLLLHEKIENGISIFMKKLLTAYSKYFNQKRQRTGALFEGCFGAQHAHNDEYLKYLFAYIHLNPVKLILGNDWKEKKIADMAEVQKFINEYYYSSYPDYAGLSRVSGRIINPEAFPQYFSSKKEFKYSMFEWLNKAP